MNGFLGVYSFFFFKQKTAYEMLRSLVGSEMCIRDRLDHLGEQPRHRDAGQQIGGLAKHIALAVAVTLLRASGLRMDREQALHRIGGLQRKLGTAFHFWRSERSLRQLDDRAMQLLTEVGLDDLADEVTVNLPYGRKRALEIATTLSMEPELMLLDEPTQGMGHEDVDRVTDLIRKVSVGRTILMVEHNMKVVSTIADRITVLAAGEILAAGSPQDIRANAAVQAAYLGTG